MYLQKQSQILDGLYNYKHKEKAISLKLNTDLVKYRRVESSETSFAKGIESHEVLVPEIGIPGRMRTIT